MAKLVTPTIQQSPTSENQNLYSNGVNEDKNCSAMLIDLEALHCPVCFDALTDHIYQCDNGHIVCYTCRNKLKNKCSACSLPVGGIRCRALERVIKAIIVPCPNSKLGCTKRFYFGTEITHQKECNFSLCSCPAKYCDYNGSYKDLYSHFVIHSGEKMYNNPFVFGQPRDIYFGSSEYVSVMKEVKSGLLFAVQCFREPIGVYLIVSCIAPSSAEVGEFSSHISMAVDKYTMTFEFPKVKRAQELDFKTPEEDFMLIPSYILCGRQSLKLRIFVKKLNQK